MMALKNQLPDLSQYAKLTDLSGFATTTALNTLQTQVNTLSSQVTTLTTQLGTVCNAVKNASVNVPGIGVIPVTVNTGGVC